LSWRRPGGPRQGEDKTGTYAALGSISDAANPLIEASAFFFSLYAMVQAVVFGAGVVLVLATPIAWLLAPMAQARHAREMNERDPTRSFEM
jgi:hypothetical protein